MHFTKMLSVCCAIVIGAFITTETNAQCLTAGFGQWPSAAFTPACNGSVETISTASWTDEYSEVVVTAGENYTFSSSVATHLITISADGGATAAAFGTGSVAWTATVSDTVRFYTHLSAACDGEQISHSRNVACGDTDCPNGNIGDSCDDGDPNTFGDSIQADCSCAGAPATGDCFNEDAFATADAPANNITLTISTCSFQSEYSTINSVVAGSTYEFNIVEGGYITLRRDSAAGAVVAQGNAPISYTSTDGASLFPHWNTDAACGTATTCVETTIQCTSCGTECPNGNIGDPCDDGNPQTEGETIQEDCSCSGGTIPPANNDCADVNSLLQCGQSIDATTEGATEASNEPSGCGFTPFDTFDVWYAFQANGTDNYTVTVAPGADAVSWDGVLYVYSGPCADLTEVSCSDSSFSQGTEAIELIAPAAGIYYVQLYDYSGTDSYTISLDCESSCSQPFPAVDPGSISTTQVGNGYLTEWDAVPGQIGCQIQARLAGGPGLLGAQIVGGANADSFVIPFGVLQPNTDYEWRVRCGCSQNPIVAGPFSAWQPFSTPGSAIASQPNPTEGQSNVTFTVIEDSYTTLEVYDMSGRMVDAIFTGNAQANNDYRFEFDGSSLPNGVYIYRLTTENEVVNEKFIIAR